MDKQAVPVWMQLVLTVLTAAVGLLSGLVLQMHKRRQEVAALGEQREREREMELGARESDREKELAAREREREREIQEREREKEKGRAAIRLTYLDPLLVAARDLVERLKLIDDKLKNEPRDRNQEMLARFHRVKHPDFGSTIEFAEWCNSVGYFAISTTYLTVVYFAHASRVRRKFPFGSLSTAEGKQLLDGIDGVRRAIGSEFGIFEAIQDSVGDYVEGADGAIMSYRVFCERMFNPEERAWLLRVIDYYRDIDKKLDHERAALINSLGSLVHSVEVMAGLRQ